MALIILLSFAIGIALILLIGGTASPMERQGETAGGLTGMDLATFEGLCVTLVRDLGLEIKRVTRVGGDTVDIVAVKKDEITGGDYVIECILRNDGTPVEASRVLSLSDTVKAERALKGIMIATGGFCQEAFKIADEAPVRLIDGPEFFRVLRAHGIRVGEGRSAA